MTQEWCTSMRLIKLLIRRAVFSRFFIPEVWPDLDLLIESYDELTIYIIHHKDLILGEDPD